eukprot:TRINITY_DN23483_c0_g1_i2.p1 TRINITY_DN23483_c0_g1~~TRINITY_DN23483_c0_g1_i2.p1  ORF type:complete len:601 (+),score=116.42 TRINITY_DN23483_c0_g1_i2:70-1872(+)
MADVDDEAACQRPSPPAGAKQNGLGSASALEPTLCDKGSRRAASATALGYVMVAGGALYKLPQALQIQRARSARGVSLGSSVLGMLSQTFSVAYALEEGHPFSAYGEAIPAFATTLVIALQTLRFERRASALRLVAAAAAALAAAVAACRAGGKAARAMQTAVPALTVVEKLPQAITLWKTGSAGQVSLTTSLLSLLGTVIRLYTSCCQLSHDPRAVAPHAVGCAANALICTQVIAYNTQATVTGWFSLDHPTIVDTGGKLADRQHLKQQREEASEADAEEESAGRIRLTLRLEAAPENEFWAYMQPAPSFEKSLPHLDVPQFIGDVQEIKRLLLERVLLPRFAAISYAISWENPALSTAILLWHWFLCYHTQYLCASFWLVLLMLFLRVDPRQRSSSQRGSLRHKKSNLVTGLVGGTKSLLGGTASAVGGLVSKPLEGVAKGGVKGLAHGVKDGVVGVGTGYGKALVGAVTEVRGGIMGTVDLLRGPSLKEFQQILQLTPGLRDLVRGLQPTVAGIRASLESVDDMFYWGNRRTTATLSIMITVCFTFALLLPYLASIVSRYIFLVLGTLVILAKAQEESVRHLQVVRACAAGKQPDCG